MRFGRVGVFTMRSLALIVGFAMAICGVAQEARPKALPPRAAALAKSKSLVEELFAADLKAATTPAAHLKLAAVFAKQAFENKDEPANRFVLLEEAQRQAALGGDVPLALSYLDELTRAFDVEP